MITSDLIDASEAIQEIMDDFMNDFMNDFLHRHNHSKQEIIKLAARVLRLQSLLMDMGILIDMEGSE